jgi:hypothetical protein
VSRQLLIKILEFGFFLGRAYCWSKPFKQADGFGKPPGRLVTTRNQHRRPESAYSTGRHMPLPLCTLLMWVSPESETQRANENHLPLQEEFQVLSSRNPSPTCLLAPLTEPGNGAWPAPSAQRYALSQESVLRDRRSGRMEKLRWTMILPALCFRYTFSPGCWVSPFPILLLVFFLRGCN